MAGAAASAAFGAFGAAGFPAGFGARAEPVRAFGARAFGPAPAFNAPLPCAAAGGFFRLAAPAAFGACGAADFAAGFDARAEPVLAFGARAFGAEPALAFAARAFGEEPLFDFGARAFGSAPAFDAPLSCAAAGGFFRLVAPDFEGRAAVLEAAEALAAGLRGEAAFAGDFPAAADFLVAADFLAAAGFFSAVLPVTRAAGRGAAFSPPVRVLDDSAIFPVVATLASEGFGADERRRGN